VIVPAIKAVVPLQHVADQQPLLCARQPERIEELSRRKATQRTQRQVRDYIMTSVQHNNMRSD